VGASFYLIAAAVALPLALVAGWFVPRLSWFAVFLGPLVGTAIARAVRWAVRRRRAQYTWLLVCGAIVVGGLLPVIASVLMSLALSLGGGGAGALGKLLTGSLWTWLWTAIYLVTAVGSAYAWLRPGRKR
jgi:hypothetical protein